MPGFSRVIRGLPAVLTLILLWAPGSSSSPGSSASESFATASIVLDATYALPTFVQFEPGRQPAVSEFFGALRIAYPLPADHTFLLVRSEPDAIGEIHHRYQQLYKSLPIVGAEYILHERSGTVARANGALVSGLSLAANPELVEPAGLAAALRHVGAKSYMWQHAFWEQNLKERTGDPSATHHPRGVLCWVSDRLGSADEPGTYRLAYQFDVHAADPPSAQRVFVDARTGAIVITLPLESNCVATSVNSVWNGNQNISTEKYTATDFRVRDDCQAGAIRIRDWNSTTTTPAALDIENTTNTWTTQNERFAATVLWETKACYQYYLNTFGRASYNNANGSIDGFINAVFSCPAPPAGCTTVDNASMSFSGGTLKVGLGSSGTLANSWGPLDVIGHEYTHAVTGSSAQLVYLNESGALNESFSDIFGDAIENNVTSANDWLVGGDRTNGAIRSLSNPNAFNDPDTYRGTNWVTGTGDNGGVHSNSGVQNFWFFLLSQGGTGTNDNGWAYNVNGIGLAKATAIAYRNLTVYLMSSSTYSAARTGSIAAAADLYGDGSAEQQAVIRAWRAVGIDPCVVTCPGEVTAANELNQCGALVSYPAPTDNGMCFTVTSNPASGTQFPVGTTAVTATSTSGASCTFNVVVNDTQAPAVTCPANISQANDAGVCGAVVTYAPTAADNCPGVTVVSSPPSGSFFPVGPTTVTTTATDGAGIEASCQFVVTVVDTTRPEITVALDRYSLWPPNHKMATIRATVTITDNCPGATFALISVTSNEPVNGGGDGNTSPDWAGASIGSPDTEFQLRSERSGKGSGREYTIVYRVTDGSGNQADATTRVRVRHDASATVAVLRGAKSDGSGLEPRATSVVVVVPSVSLGSAMLFDAKSVVRSEAQLGNTYGVVGAISNQLLDVSGDGLRDLVLTFPAAALRALVLASAGSKVDLHYVTTADRGFVASNIFAFGSSIGVIANETGEMERESGVRGLAEPGQAALRPAPHGEPSATTLTWVRPSPFSSSTTIGFDIARRSHVRIGMYDVTGRRVRTLESASRPAGHHSVTWDGLDDAGRRAGTGVYFVRFEADGVTGRIKVVRMP